MNDPILARGGARYPRRLSRRGFIALGASLGAAPTPTTQVHSALESVPLILEERALRRHKHLLRQSRLLGTGAIRCRQ